MLKPSDIPVFDQTFINYAPELTRKPATTREAETVQTAVLNQINGRLLLEPSAQGQV
ncbi:hypothetical protein EUX98_g7054 [Antrodiella citrinella]|uniref:Uncharacterized protein n=1 Tax=Antrodiella citrinella TaxID=2447956 RepID=A0A4S4MMN7_9APHY|nr:hypothetical protein EUX98_g7054 [Antrodiella citrinella]